MERQNKNFSSQNNKSKWIIAILFLVLFPPLGVYYIWKEKQFFSKKIPLLILFFGVGTLISSLILLTTWLPTLKDNLRELGLNIPTYPSIVLTFVIFFSIIQIVLAFIIDKKQTSSQLLPKNYLIVALIFLAINLILVPLVFITVKRSVSQQLYKILVPFEAPKEEVKVPEEVEIPKEEIVSIPRFEDFYVSEKFKGEPVAVDFSSNPDALRFVTRITEGVKQGPNFAGHYTIIEWGCGTECQSGVVVDAKTGAIDWLPWSAFRREFRIDSNLLIINPPDNIYEPYKSLKPFWLTTDYYRWENNQFVLIYTTGTADWKTYRDVRYGFEIKCPGDWKKEEAWWVEKPKVFLTCAPEEDPKERFISVKVRDVLPEEIQCIQTTNLLPAKVLGEINVNNKFCIMEYKFEGDYSIIYLAVKDGIGYEISLSNKYIRKTDKGLSIEASLSEEDVKNRPYFFDQILSTFRFLE